MNADTEKELVELRQMARDHEDEIESLERERQEWIKFAEIDKAKIRTLEAALMANLALLQTYIGRK